MAKTSIRSDRQSSGSQLQDTLSQLHGDVTLPSTLNYNERTELRRKDAYEYGRIYNNSSMRGQTVYDRLTADASVRQTLKTVIQSAAPADDKNGFAGMVHAAAVAAAATAAAGMDKSSSSKHKQTMPSGFVSNNNPNLSCKQQTQDTACSAQPPLSALHPITLRSYHKKFPMDFLAAARPQTRTTTETMRMLGTYSCDSAVAQRLGVHIPHGSSCASLTCQ